MTATQYVTLRHAAAMPRRVRLRELTGSDELALDGTDALAAVALLDRLSPMLPSGAGELSPSDRDQLLAAVHRSVWGDHIVASLQCRSCESAYDLSFELSDLEHRLWSQPSSALDMGEVRVRGLRLLQIAGASWRLPKAEDETHAAALGLDEGAAALHRLLFDSLVTDTSLEQSAPTGDASPAPSPERARCAELLDTLAPIIDVDLEAPCPECQSVQVARFDVQTFVLQRLLDERQGLLSEVHSLASGYGWSLDQILSLPRSMRRSLVERLKAAAAFS